MKRDFSAGLSLSNDLACCLEGDLTHLGAERFLSHMELPWLSKVGSCYSGKCLELGLFQRPSTHDLNQ